VSTLNSAITAYVKRRRMVTGGSIGSAARKASFVSGQNTVASPVAAAAGRSLSPPVPLAYKPGSMRAEDGSIVRPGFYSRRRYR
jgi:hypothetical protein